MLSVPVIAWTWAIVSWLIGPLLSLADSLVSGQLAQSSAAGSCVQPLNPWK